MRVRSSTTFGRSTELGQLVGLAELARSGHAASVLVHGVAGVGKTRLVSDLVAVLREQDALVLVGHGVHLTEGQVPFGVLSEALRDLVRSVGADRVRALLGADAEQLGSLVPALRSGPRTDVDHARIISAATDLVEALAFDRLVCWVVEDLQWTDTATCDAFGFLIRFLTSARLLVVATWRDEDDRPLGPAGGAPAEAIELRRLEGGDLDALVAAVSPGLQARERARVAELSQGLPFAVEEIVESWRPGMGVAPAYLRRLVLTRLPDLSPDAQELVELAALGEGHLDVRLLEEGLGVAPAAIRATLTAGILEADVDPGALRFRHALLREAVADAVPPGDRRRLHQRWAEAIEVDAGAVSGAARVTALATHWHEARVPERAITALAEAALAAKRLAAPSTEYAALSKVLAWWDSVASPSALTGLSREKVLVDTVQLGMSVSEFDAVFELLDAEKGRLLPGVDPIGAAWVAVRLAVFDDNFRVTQPDLGWIETLFAADLEDPRLSDCLTLLMLNGALPSDVTAQVTELAEQVLARASSTQDRLTGVRCLMSLAMREGRFTEALDLIREERPRVAAGTVGDQWTVAISEAWCLILLGRAAEAAPLLEGELGRLSRPSAVSSRYASLAENLTHAYLAVGRYDDALALARAALATLTELGEDEPILLPPDTLRGHVSDVHVVRGDLAEARRTSRLVAAHAGPEPWADRIPSAETIARLAAISAAEGDLVRCRAELAGAWDRPSSPAFSEELPRAVLVALRAESTLVDRHDPAAVAESRELVGRVMIAAEPLARPGPRGAAWWAEARAHAARSRGGDTAAGWALAVEGWRECGQPPDVAICLRFLGEAALADGDAGPAAVALAESYGICLELGARPLAEAVLAVARRGRLDVGPRAERSGSERLTARESEVLGLVALGRSNQQIATELFMSPKTVSVHVSRILGKLGVANRTEAAATGRRLGLVE